MWGNCWLSVHHNPLKLTNMTSQKNHDTLVGIVCAVCARVCTQRRYDLLSCNKGDWVGLAYFSHGTFALLRRFTATWESIIFDRHTACHTNHFGFYMGSYPPELLRLLMIVGNASRREEGEVTITISCPLCIMALFQLAFGWLVLCSIFLVHCCTLLPMFSNLFPVSYERNVK
jgi:hypothetical protein